MEANTKFDPQKLTMVDYKLTKGQVDEPEGLDGAQVEGYHVENGFELSFSLHDNLAKADITVSIRTESKGKNEAEATALYHLFYLFRVDNLPELVAKSSPNQVEVDPTLGNALAAMAYSTTRGILLARLQGTTFQKFILPVINPNDLLAR